MPRFVALIAVAAVAALAGCVIQGPPAVQEGAHHEAPITAKGSRALDAKGFDVFLMDPATGETKTYQWKATREKYEAGVYVIETEFLTLHYRVDEFLPVKLRYDEDLSRQNSFNIAYHEPKERLGRLVTHVVDVDAESYLDVKADDEVTGDVAGNFELSFTGACRDTDAGCDDPDATHRVEIEGRFPVRTH